MKELSLHILDVVGNSVKAGAKNIVISVTEDTRVNRMTIDIEDDGCGMEAAFLATVLDPFTTTQTKRKVGLGLPLFKLAAEQTGGNVSVESVPGEGTKVKAVFVLDSIDRMPMGDIAGTVVTLIRGKPDVNYVYQHICDGKSFEMSTTEIKKQLEGVPVDSPEVLQWIAEYIGENLCEITK